MNVGTRPGIKSFLLLILIAVLATASVVRAQNGVAGKWRSVAEGPGGKVVLILQLQQDGTGRWTGSAKNSREPDRIRELQQLDVQGADVSFHIDTEVPNQGITVRSKFLLRFRDTHDTLKGTIEVTAPGMQREMPMQFDRVVERAGADATSFQADRPMIGAWSARPDKDDKLRELQVDFEDDCSRSLAALCVSGGPRLTSSATGDRASPHLDPLRVLAEVGVAGFHRLHERRENLDVGMLVLLEQAGVIKGGGEVVG